MVAPHPPSVPAVTWFCRGGVEAGTWKVGVGGGGLTVVEPRAATVDGGASEIDSGVGMPWITKVTSASISPGVQVDLAGPRPGLPCGRVVTWCRRCKGRSVPDVSLWGRSVADADSVLGLTAEFGAPLVVRPSMAADCEAMVRDVAPIPDEVVEHRGRDGHPGCRRSLEGPPAKMLAGGAGDSDSTTGKLVVPDMPDTVQVNPVPREAVPWKVTPNNVTEKLSPLLTGPNTEYWSPKVKVIWVSECDEMTSPTKLPSSPACHDLVMSEKWKLSPSSEPLPPPPGVVGVPGPPAYRARSPSR